jgi:hypothetical protein
VLRASASAKASAVSIVSTSTTAPRVSRPSTAASNSGIVAHGHDQRVLPVLGLGEQVEGDRFRIGAHGEDGGQVARPREPVDAHVARDLALGFLHVEGTRADDDVDRLDARGPVGQRRDGLRPAHAVDGVDAAEGTGREDHRML